MSIKQDRIGTRTSEDLRRRLNIRKIDETIKESENREEDLTEINNRVDNISRSLNNTRTNYVSTQSQSFTETQKAQARTNIGAGNSSFSGSYDDLENKPTSLANINTTESNKLKNIEENAQENKIEGVYINGSELTLTNKKVNIYVDKSMSDYSENPVQNKVVKAYIDANSGSGGGSAVYQEYHTDYSGYVWFNDGFLAQWGRTSITPTAINTDTTARITYTYSYDNIPTRQTEISSATPNVAKATSGGGTTTSLSKQGMNIYVNSSTTRAVTVDWLATGYKGV